jgi:hypothetical protein
MWVIIKKMIGWAGHVVGVVESYKITEGKFYGKGGYIVYLGIYKGILLKQTVHK